MEVPRKKAKTCSDDTEDNGASTLTAAQQIAELQAELERCKRDKITTEQRHNEVVRDLKGSYSDLKASYSDLKENYSDALEWALQAAELQAEHNRVVKGLKGSYSDALEWAHSINTVPRDHWLEKGHTEEYADAIEEFLDALKQTIKDLRTGTVGERIVAGFNLQDEEDQCVTADHDAVLMPYWKELANALIHWSEYHAGEETLQVFVACIETPDAVLDVLCPAIKQSKVKVLGFVSDGTPKPWKLAEFVKDVIQTNHKVTTVGFDSVVLSNKEWKTICNSIRIRNAQHESIIRRFELTECFVDGVNTEVLKGILTSNIVEADLEGNGMSSREAPIIAEHLASNPPLARLFLKANRFDDTDAAVLANSLSSNTNLRVLNIEQNNVKEEGRLVLLRAIFDVTSLASCAASNHTCNVSGLEQDISDLNDYFGSSINKWDKIFTMLALSSEDLFIDTALLNGVPCTLIPVLLDKANDQSKEGKSQLTDLYLELTGTTRCRKHDVWDNLEHTRLLSCVYELVREWVAPSIYV